MADNLEILKLIADKTRIEIINALSCDDSYVERIAARLDLTPATVCYHLKKLEAAGIVKSSRSQFYIIYSLNADIFDKTLRELIITPENAPDPDEKYRAAVLSSFFKYGKLTSLPVQRKKREIVLQEILKDFAPDRDYSEEEVNEVIEKYYDDYCTVRREMIAAGLMEREREIYRVKK